MPATKQQERRIAMNRPLSRYVIGRCCRLAAAVAVAAVLAVVTSVRAGATTATGEGTAVSGDPAVALYAADLFGVRG